MNLRFEKISVRAVSSPRLGDRGPASTAPTIALHETRNQSDIAGLLRQPSLTLQAGHSGVLILSRQGGSLRTGRLGMMTSAILSSMPGPASC